MCCAYPFYQLLQEMVLDFSATAQELSASIQNLTKAINKIMVSNEEEVQGIQNIAEKASDVMQKAAIVADMMKENEFGSERLVTAVTKFRI